MNITFRELRKIKHKLPTGSVHQIASELNLDDQTVRNYFGATKYNEGDFVGKHIQSGPHGGIVNLQDDRILRAAKRIIRNAQFQEA